ncbi:uncharacterized protein IL334_004854 [Kwoniella shivajii]|uniref:Uncharacterized protein n=1 Tax=Kwoniella shivajii TaxID=564305 RepID=A0ABZ1D391_9TREE|nr:hypothetical protein IL334_004854 [Kwoniella shivajii]
MKFFATAISTVALIGAVLAQQANDITIATPPSLTQCEPVLLSWSGGVGPYILTAIPGGQPSAAALATISASEAGNSVTWKVNVAAGTEVTVKVTDSRGINQYTSPVQILPGSDSCLGAASGGSTSNSSTPSSAAAGGVASSAASAASSAVSAASSGASSAASAATSAAGIKTTTTQTAPTSTVTGSGSASAASGTSKASTPASSGSASGSAPASASSTGASSGALKNGIIAAPAIIIAALGAFVALF